MNTPRARRAYRGPALFSYGFRPFFLLAGIWAVIAPPLWLIAYFGAASPALTLTRDWHVHEMVFGYAAAVLAGFLSTSIPNWTGRLPILGAPLAFLASVWLCGRVAMLLGGPLGWVAPAIDASFLILFAAAIWREILAGKNWRNVPVAGLVSAFACANIAFHLRAHWPDLGAIAERLALGVIAVMIALIGGRIVPSFTRNWLAQQGAQSFPKPMSRVDQASMACVVVGVASWIIMPEAAAAGVSLCVAGCAQAYRMARWRGFATFREPLVWVLHAGYGWLAAALIMMGASVLAPEAIPRSAGLHALTAGAIGVMTLAVMTRATRGHTGRILHAGAGTLAIYLLANVGAALRVAGAFAGPTQNATLSLAGGIWSAAFVGFVIVYGPMLIGARRPAA